MSGDAVVLLASSTVVVVACGAVSTGMPRALEVWLAVPRLVMSELWMADALIPDGGMIVT